MCGIFAFLNNSNLFGDSHLKSYFKKGSKRGPENSQFCKIDDDTLLGFHRLAINGLNDASNQPIVIDNIYLVCNGEIYNHKELFKELGITPKTQSDCEIIIHMYKKYGIDYTLSQLDGVFAFILIDHKHLFVARDPYGVRPLFHLQPKELNGSMVEGFASTLSSLDGITQLVNGNEKISQFPPSNYFYYYYDKVNVWTLKKKQCYTVPGIKTITNLTDESDALKLIKCGLEQAVQKRVENTDRPIACLLSGGLDSSLITALVSKFMKERFQENTVLETYSIGLKGAEDLKYARMVADHLGTKHKEIIVSEDTFFDAIPHVIYNIESYDTTTVRASVGNYLIGRYISKQSKAKVIFNGDGSDELAGGYMYFHAAPDAMSFDYECKRLLSNIHFFDVLRSDRSISSHGLEPRTPFLDRGFVQDYLSISKHLRCHTQNKQCEKYLLRKAFDNVENPLLPKEVLWRQKEAFSDGVSSLNRSWYSIIDEKIIAQFGKRYDINPDTVIYGINPPRTREQCYYRSIFRKYFSQPQVIPYFWMPQFVADANDSSARTLKVYSQNSGV